MQVAYAVSKDLPFNNGDNVGLMINGLGGTRRVSFSCCNRRAALRCKDAGLNVVRNYVGEYCTSLEMAGFSLTLIRLDDELARLLDAPAEIAWRVF
jgi:dihydroxyacetone kinase-like protein